MNAQELEYVRIMLRHALADYSGSTKGQLEAFAERPLADRNLHPRQPLHVVELDDGRGGVRQVRKQNSAMYVLETRSRRCPAPPIKENEFCEVPWRRAVNALPEHQQAWLRYCYGFDLRFRYQTLICETVWNAHQKNLPDGLLMKTKKRIVSLVWLAAQDVAAVQHNESYKEYAGVLLANRLGVSRTTWCKIYKQYWTALKTAFFELDQNAVLSALAGYVETLPVEAR